MINTPAFAELVKATRGTRSQAALADKADTFRQRFGQIESGQPVEISEVALAQLDDAFEWPHGFAAAALRATQSDEPPVNYQPFYAVEGDVTQLGYFDNGSIVHSANRIATTAPATAFIPLITAAARTTLVDVTTLTDYSERSEFVTLAATWDEVTHRAGHALRTGISTEWALAAEPAAVDPLPGITSLNQALTFTGRIRAVRGETSSHRDMSTALTLLAAAVDLDAVQHDPGGPARVSPADGLEFICGMVASSSPAWPTLLSVAGLDKNRYHQVDLTKTFRGLLDARDAMVDITFTPGDPDSITSPRKPKTIAAQNLKNMLVLFDSTVSPELPLVVHDALAAAGEPRPIVITNNTNELIPTDFTGLAIEPNGIPGPLPTDEKWLLEWRNAQLGYATITNYSADTRRAVYTERGQSYGIDLPEAYTAVHPRV